jgi:hypothetical protein
VINISGVAMLANLIGRNISTARQKTTQGGALKPAVQADAKKSLNTSSKQAKDLHSVLVRRIGAIDPDDPQSRHKALRVFLETVLLAELGDELMSDPDFYQLVEHVQATMEGDVELAESIAEAMSILLSDKDRT